MAIHKGHAVHLSRQGTDGSMLSHLILLAIAFSIIRVIDSNFFYQRRGLMFDVSDPIFRFMKIIIHRLIKSVSYSVFKV